MSADPPRPGLPRPEVEWRGQGPPLVLLHPLGVDSTVWAPAETELPGLSLLAYDLPGHGRTPAPAQRCTVEDLAEQLAGILTDAGRGPAHVVGVSLGGLVAQVLAAAHPALVDRLVLVDAVATYPPPVREQWRARPQVVREQGMAPLLAPTLDLWFTAAALEQGHPAVETVRRLFLAGDPEGYARACEALEVADTTAVVPRIGAPTLVLCGDDDAPPFTAAAPWLAATVQDGRLVWLSPARHAGALEQPGQFYGAVRSFLSGPGDGGPAA